MSTEGFQRFIHTAKRDWKLNDEFTAAVADFARKSGFNVDAQDVRDFLDTMPAERAENEPVEGGATTLALGEEDEKGRPSVTLAIGEEDNRRATTMAVGEEGRKVDRLPPMTVTSMALGEEEKKGDDGLNQRDRDRANDFDDMYKDNGPGVTSMALGEEDKKPAPPKGPGVTTMAVGEEGKKPRPPGPR